MSAIIRNLMLVTLLMGIRSGFAQTSRNLKQLDSLLEKAHTLGMFNDFFSGPGL